MIGVTAFKAKCLALIDAVATGKLERVVLTRRGKPVAEISALRACPEDFHEVSWPWAG
jgi:antitoxin (DNA-binding transcriptional repressor) of toxin-antitoxin stability system